LKAHVFFEACRKKRATLADALDNLARADSLQAIYADGDNWLRLNENAASPSSYQDATSKLAKLFQPHINNDAQDTQNARFALSAMTISSDRYTDSTLLELRPPAQQSVLIPSLSKFGQSFAVHIQDGALALVSEHEAQAAEAVATPTLITAICGTADLSHISHLGIRYSNEHWELLVFRRVPFLGWLVLILSLCAVSSGFPAGAIVDKRTPLSDLYATPHLFALLFWRSTAATLMALPLCFYRSQRAKRIRRQYQRDLYDQNLKTTPNDITFVFLLNLFQQPALWLTVSAAWLGGTASMFSYRFLKGSDVYLIWNLVPIVVLLFRWSGIMDGTPVQPLEVLAAALALFGATCMAVNAPASAILLQARNPLIGIFLAFVGVFGRAANGVSASRLVAVENNGKITAPLTVHLITQMSCSLMWLICLVTFDSEGHFVGFDRSHLGFDRLFGALAFLLPSFDRLPCYLYLSIVADTLGTLGSLVALRHLDPLIVSVATLFTPSISVLSMASLGFAPCPGIGYFLGVLILLISSYLLVALAAKPHTSLVDIDNAIVPLQKNIAATVAEPIYDDDPRLGYLVAESLYNQRAFLKENEIDVAKRWQAAATWNENEESCFRFYRAFDGGASTSFDSGGPIVINRQQGSYYFRLDENSDESNNTISLTGIDSDTHSLHDKITRH